MNALSRTESRRLAELEAVVTAGIQTFHEVGKALLAIRAEKLYRATHATWEDYCRDRWGFSRVHAFRLIEAAGVADTLPMGNTPANERQARELAPLPAEARRAVWEQATAGGAAPTAARLHELAAKALAGLPAEEQAEVVAASEAGILAGAEARQVGGEGRAGRMQQIGRLLARLKKLIEGLGDEAAPVLRLLGAVSVALHALPED